ncbi:uncharacterized protein LOC135195766 isoform X2 [Macrobrachium nipponense]
MARLKVFLFLMLMVSVPTNCEDTSGELEQQSDSGSNGSVDSKSNEGKIPTPAEIEEFLKDLLRKYEGLHIPALPTFTFDNGGGISAALSVSDIMLNGLLDLKVNLKLSLNKLTITATFNKVYLDVGRYSSGGHLLNLPFAGEGPLLIAIHKLKIGVEVDFKKSIDRGVCVGDIYGLSTKLILDQRRLEVKFSNMNPGGDQGQLINLVLSSFGPDILDYLKILLTGKDKEVADRIVVDVRQHGALSWLGSATIPWITETKWPNT